MMKSILFPICGFCLLLVSCSSTPGDRIYENMTVYQALTPHQQTEVRNGRIENGMPPEAVLLAWGDPNYKSKGNIDGKSSERWSYGNSRSNVSFGLGGGYGGFSRHSGMGSGIGTGINIPLGGSPSVPENYVLFINGRVVAWAWDGEFKR